MACDRVRQFPWAREIWVGVQWRVAFRDGTSVTFPENTGDAARDDLAVQLASALVSLLAAKAVLP